jgi:hypothetical protein
MKSVLICLLVSVSMISFAQKKRLPNEFAKTITADDLKKHLYTLSGKEMEGRETGFRRTKKSSEVY